MTVYVDNMFRRQDVKNGRNLVRGTWCHMMADTHEELEAMARLIGMRPEWIQYPGTYKEHYDVTKERRALALKNGAVELPIGPAWRDFLARKKQQFLHKR